MTASGGMRRHRATAAFALVLAMVVLGEREAQAQCDAAGSWLRSPASNIGENANLLLDGRILYSSGAPQLYDTTLGLWSPAAAMNEPVGGTRTLLPDGRVLAVGQDSAEFYDPRTDSWDYTRDLSNPDPATNRTRPRFRSAHTATLLRDGRVLLAGGRNPTAMTHAQAFDPKTGKFVGNWNMVGARAFHSATLLEDGTVLVVGGAICAFNGADYATNGPAGCKTSRDNRAQITTQIFDPVTSRWSDGPPITTARYAHTATRLTSGYVLIAGGLQQNHEAGSQIASAQVYDLNCLGPGNPCWRAEIPLNRGRYHHAATLLPSGRLLLAGGTVSWTGGPVGDAEIYDGSAFATFCNAPGFTSGMMNGTLLPDGRVFLASGNEALHYQERTYTTVDAAPLAERRSSHQATLLADGRVLITGGIAWGGNPGPQLATSQVYEPTLPADPAAGRHRRRCWSLVPAIRPTCSRMDGFSSPAGTTARTRSRAWRSTIRARPAAASAPEPGARHRRSSTWSETATA